VPGGYILLAARLVPEKRVEDLIAAFRAMDTPARLAIVGSASYTSRYVDGLHRLAAGDTRIVFTGFQHGPALRALFLGARVFVLPSELEGLPMSLLESMAYGIPAVVSDIPPHRELLAAIPGYDLFFPVGEVGTLRTRLRQCLEREPRYRRIAARARAAVERSHAWPLIADATEEVFRQAVERDSA